MEPKYADDFKAPATIADGEERKGALATKLHSIFAEAAEGSPTDEHGRQSYDYGKVKSIDGDSLRVAEVIKQHNAELEDLAKWVNFQATARQLHEQAQEILAKQKEPVSRPGMPGPETKRVAAGLDLGKSFVESKAFTEWNSGQSQGPSADLNIDLKTLFERTAGWLPETVRDGRVELDPQRPIAVVNFIPSSPISQNAAKYMEETTFSSGAQEIAEGAAYQESQFVLTERTQTVEKIAVFLPVTDEQLEDEAAAASYLNNRLLYQIQARLDSQILAGNGSTPNILGQGSLSGKNTQAKGVDPVLDAIYKGHDLIRTVGFADPTATFMHPTDWQAIRLLRTTEGLYIMGNPTELGPTQVWGVPMVLTTAQAQNTAETGDYRQFSELRIRRGVTVKVSDSHSDFFVKGKQAIRADMRVAMVWYRPEAFTEITGI